MKCMELCTSVSKTQRSRMLKPVAAPHTLKVDGPSGGEGSRVLGFVSVSFKNGEVELCYKFHVLERLVSLTSYIFHVLLCSFLYCVC